MPSQRFYETTLQSQSGASAGVISVPRPNVLWDRNRPPADVLARDLGFEVKERDLASDDLLPVLFQASTLDAQEGDPEAFTETLNLAAELVYAPIVIVEQSPPVGQALASIPGFGGTAALVAIGASPVVVVVYVAAWAIAWFVSPVVGGAREGVRDGPRGGTAPHRTAAPGRRPRVQPLPTRTDSRRGAGLRQHRVGQPGGTPKRASPVTPTTVAARKPVRLGGARMAVVGWPSLLTDRALERVQRLDAGGATAVEVADQMGWSVRTVRTARGLLRDRQPEPAPLAGLDPVALESALVRAAGQ